MIQNERLFQLNNLPVKKGPVVYWMSRDQRVENNEALIYALDMARQSQQTLVVVFCVDTSYPGANIRHFSFMLLGLIEVETLLNEKHIPLVVLKGNPPQKIVDFVREMNAGHLVCDFDPLRIKQKWLYHVAKSLRIAVTEVDAHNVVPCRLASAKVEYGAYTLRPKINRLLPSFLQEYEVIEPLPKHQRIQITGESLEKLLYDPDIDHSVAEIKDVKAGTIAAYFVLQDFIEHKLDFYSTKRNDPNEDFQSGLSPYLHFGQISAAEVAIDVIRSGKNAASVAAFLEELIVRKELSDNFCLYNSDYDNIKGFPVWAQENFRKHRSDKREYLYSLKEFETANTHDELWNAAQRQMVKTAKMHGYMRMYWAKKILEWTASPEEAMRAAICLNDKYMLDGRDPNGYAGIAWSIGGVHDRAWTSRPVFGKVRYMNYNGCKRKFDVAKYIARN
ncbi:MAG: deoxyribodipyrimidine photolyase [Bacteroidetes bacterium HGW-Bacteroidetes-21]|jgi:deoxyribodipyrimidine photo-lyase|nr:MAG: deoxyribodipyrimidine photolyase [Bacteroidetes bacterium HGW-Bacteroidetes-21]